MRGRLCITHHYHGVQNRVFLCKSEIQVWTYSDSRVRFDPHNWKKAVQYGFLRLQNLYYVVQNNGFLVTPRVKLHVLLLAKAEIWRN